MSKTKLARLKWYEFQTNHHVNTLGQLLLDSPYKDDIGKGFDLALVTESTIQGLFIEKIAENSISVDPYGNYIETAIVRFARTYFKIIYVSRDRYLLCLVNPPRSIKGIFDYFSRAFPSEFFFKQILYNVADFYDLLTGSRGIDRYLVRRVSVCSVPFTNNSVANIEVMSQTNALTELASIYKAHEYKLRRLELEARVDGANVSIDLRDSGVVSASNEIVDLLDACIQKLHFS